MSLALSLTTGRKLRLALELSAPLHPLPLFDQGLMVERLLVFLHPRFPQLCSWEGSLLVQPMKKNLPREELEGHSPLGLCIQPE